VRAVGVRCVALATVSGWLLARSAPAKEHTAACPELAGMIGRVRTTLEAATGQRRRGSSLGAFQVLRSTTASMLRDSAGEHCGALGPTLTSALRRATTARTALDASVELDLGLDAALSLATDGHLPYASAPPKVPTMPPTMPPRMSSTTSPLTPPAATTPSPASARAIGEAAFYAQDCPDLFPITLRLEGPPPELPERVAALLADLAARPRCARVRRLLAQAPAERLPHAVDSIRLDEPDELESSSGADLSTRCPEIPLVVERLGAAIDLGAPQYNAGDTEDCRHTYEVAARAVTTQILAEDHCPGVRALLGAGVARAARAATPNQAAWALRRSFDAVLSGAHAAAP
jgi:hypothetical protein